MFEKAVRCFAENPTENVMTLVLGTTFNSGRGIQFLQFVFMGKGVCHPVRQEPAKFREDEVHAGDSLWVLG